MGARIQIYLTPNGLSVLPWIFYINFGIKFFVSYAGIQNREH